ncbi:NADH-quinone oxidoreductase subunit M [Thermithiobacillus plumbiphilus]|uniref:NADH-quinone oxidoreductase subunit M n=1 Tax=Thermithiobacillus plumbiphilus TaxID=1729899 RepID=A0ABU9D720_9PROT
MLSLAIFLPLLGALLILLIPASRVKVIRNTANLTTSLTLALWLTIGLNFRLDGGFQFVEFLPWIKSLGISYHLGVDGLSLALLLMTALLFWSALVFSWTQTERAKEYFAWFLFLESACLGVFAALDLFLFYIFWDLTLVGMYFIIAIWGHEQARRAATWFFIYTLVGSLALLLAIIGLYLNTQPLSMDMLEIIRQQPLAGGWLAQLVFLGFFLGFAIKLPLVPFHTWLPLAHTEAPAAGSTILAAVLLKMGGYGFLRILLPMLPDTFRQYALALVLLGVISVIYGALAALAQTHFKRMVAYTSVNHMGYVMMGIGALGVWQGSEAARTLAYNGAVLQMVSHGLITGALFLISGMLWTRAHSFDMDAFGGLGRIVPVFTAVTGLLAFASLGLPGLSGFVAEFQIFVGTFSVYPWAAAVALLGIVITAALFLRALQRLFLGPVNAQWTGMADLKAHELIALAPLLLLVILIGILPGWLIDLINAAMHWKGS